MAAVDIEGLLRALEASVGAGQAQVESLLSFLRERSALDEGYAGRLLRLTRTALPLDESTADPLAFEALASLKGDVANESVQFSEFAANVQRDVLEPLLRLKEGGDTVAKRALLIKQLAKELKAALERCKKMYSRYLGLHSKATSACLMAGIAPPELWAPVEQQPAPLPSPPLQRPAPSPSTPTRQRSQAEEAAAAATPAAAAAAAVAAAPAAGGGAPDLFLGMSVSSSGASAAAPAAAQLANPFEAATPRLNPEAAPPARRPIERGIDLNIATAPACAACTLIQGLLGGYDDHTARAAQQWAACRGRHCAGAHVEMAIVSTSHCNHCRSGLRCHSADTSVLLPLLAAKAARPAHVRPRCHSGLAA